MFYHRPPTLETVSVVRPQNRIGLWLIGACGGVGSTVALGVAALRRGLVSTCGLVTDLPPFRTAGLVGPGTIVVGGHEVRSESIITAVRSSNKRSGVFNHDLIQTCAPDLRATERNIRPGTVYGLSTILAREADRAGLRRERKPVAIVERLASDIQAFRKRNRLDTVIAVNVASSEPAIRRVAAHGEYAKLQQALARANSNALPTSSIYALAAIEAGCAYVNFTPSTGIEIPAIRERADQLGRPYMGRDGKTGETLVKSALAPMFAMRNLSILSWVGQNILGNRDGAVLRDPRVRAAKVRSKDKTVSRIAGRATATSVSIDFVPSLDDWKVAWDFIHFEGFLGTKMNMQFTWQGSDSILAAPLVIDLARLAALQCRAGRSGPMQHLAFFFKDPMGVDEYDLHRQWERLVQYVATNESPTSSRLSPRRQKHGVRRR